MPEVKFVEDRRTAITSAELAQMKVQAQVDNGEVSSLLFEGRCPTCDHLTRDVIPVQHLTTEVGGPLDEVSQILAHELNAEVVATALPGRRAFSKIRLGKTSPPAGQQAQLPVVVTCHCPSDHPGARGRFGCGRSWMMRVSFDPASAAAVLVSLPTDANLAYWNELVASQAIPGDPLASARESGDKWQKALAAVFGVVGVTTLLSRDTIDKLEDPWPACLTAAVLFVLLATAVATYWAHQAAIGFPKFGSITSVDDLNKFSQAPLHQAKAAVRHLRQAAVLSAVAFAVSLFALAGVLLAPAASSPSTKIKIKINDAELTCVTVQDSPKQATLRYTTTDKTTQDVPLSDIVQLAGAC